MKIAVIYATTTGNTEAMAKAVCDAAKGTGAEVIFGTADSADKSGVLACDVLLLGSPAMGDEILEDTMEEFFASIEGSISGKKVALFGSYDWGDGQWLWDWADRAKKAGATLVSEPLMVNLTPSDDDLAKCKEWAVSAIK